MNFATLIATKASRVCQAAGDDAVLEFGLRRAQGVDGGLTASRAAYLGGCAGTSNVLAGRLFDIPVKGTHAHSWVMSFDDELEAFRAYAEVMPNNCVFLVDTYDTAEGVRHAITTGEALRARGFRLAGVRLDSGDLAALSRHARSALDEAGFGDASIVASNDLDEYAIRDLKGAGAAIDVWGIGTKLATAYDQPALGGVYKLSAIRDEDGRWTPRVKLSEQPIKTSNPGIQQVRRYYDSDGNMLGDVLFDTLDGDAPTACAAGGSDPELDFDLPAGAEHQDLLVPIFRGGEQVRACPSLADARAHRAAQLARLPEAHRRLDEPRPYPVALDEGLYETRSRLIRQARGEQS